MTCPKCRHSAQIVAGQEGKVWHCLNCSYWWPVTVELVELKVEMTFKIKRAPTPEYLVYE